MSVLCIFSFLKCHKQSNSFFLFFSPPFFFFFLYLQWGTDPRGSAGQEGFLEEDVQVPERRQWHQQPVGAGHVGVYHRALWHHHRPALPIQIASHFTSQKVETANRWVDCCRGKEPLMLNKTKLILNEEKWLNWNFFSHWNIIRWFWYTSRSRREFYFFTFLCCLTPDGNRNLEHQKLKRVALSLKVLVRNAAKLTIRSPWHSEAEYISMITSHSLTPCALYVQHCKHFLPHGQATSSLWSVLCSFFVH